MSPVARLAIGRLVVSRHELRRRRCPEGPVRAGLRLSSPRRRAPKLLPFDCSDLSAVSSEGVKGNLQRPWHQCHDVVVAKEDKIGKKIAVLAVRRKAHAKSRPSFSFHLRPLGSVTLPHRMHSNPFPREWGLCQVF